MSCYIGIDVSKRTLDCAIVVNGTVVLEDKIANEKSAVKKFLMDLKDRFKLNLNEVVVCMEHTGIYNHKALEVLHKHEVRICLEPALQIKLSQGMTRGKDDRVDARRIGIYVYKNREQLTFWKPQRETFQKLQALLTLRERLIRVQKQLRVPLNESVDFLSSEVVKPLKGSSDPILRLIEKKLRELDKQIMAIAMTDPDVKKQYNHAVSVPGVGPIIALNMIVRTDGFQKIKDPKKFACYAGVAPFKHQSGSSIRGKTRVSKLANMKIKTLLSLGATSAVTYSPELRQYYQRKVAEGKKPLSVINAVRNKLITRVFACVLQERKYEKKYQYALA
jgi:transposase